MKNWLAGLGVLGAALTLPALAFAADGPDNVTLGASADAIWVFLASVLVILMQGGFALLETGATRMKNAGHVAGKTILTFGICALAFWAFGFGIAFGDGNSFIGTTGFFMDGMDSTVFASLAYSTVPISIKFLFQVAFAGVSLAIVWGGFAERGKLSVYFIFGALYTIFVYPVVAHWIWGGGWLGTGDNIAQDFAGSTVVHLQGATAALVATILLKPRLGKFNKDGSPNLIPGHNQVYSVLGVILLLVGWFGFNPGSTLGAMSPELFGFVAFNTLIAACAGGVAAMVVSWIYFGKADITSMLNGVLAALVAITASCAYVEAWGAFVIGLVAGVVTFFTAQWIEKFRVDDPIFAFSVHGVAGIWGTLSTGLFASGALIEKFALFGQSGLFYGGGLHQLGVQAIGVFSAMAYVIVVSGIILYVIKLTIGLRVTEEEEVVGLDLSEHGSYGYPEQMKASSTPASGLSK